MGPEALFDSLRFWGKPGRGYTFEVLENFYFGDFGHGSKGVNGVFPPLRRI